MTTALKAGNGTMDFSQVAYKLAAVSELINTPEEARELTRDSYSGIRIVLEESAELLLNVDDAPERNLDRQGYKLLTVAALIDTPEQAEQISMDVWSGIRINVEEVTEYLLNV